MSLPLEIVVAGNSTALLVRPPRQGPEEANFGTLVARALSRQYVVRLTNLARWSGLVSEAAERVYDDLVPLDADVVFLVFGINECVPRVVPLGMWRRLNAKGIGPARAAAVVDRLTRPILRRAGVPWISEGQFERYLRFLVEVLQKEGQPTVLLCNIPPTTDRVRARLGGIDDAIERYNRCVTAAAAGLPRTYLIDVHRLASNPGVDAFVPDGIHFSALGHQMIADEILGVLAREPHPWLASPRFER